MANWFCGRICRMWRGLVHHIIIIPAALSLPPLRGAAVGRAPTIFRSFQNDWVCTRISNFSQSALFSIVSSSFPGSSIYSKLFCSQRLSMSAGSKRQVLENYFPGWIRCMFPISKCRGDWDLGVCIFWVLRKGEPCAAQWRLAKTKCLAAGNIGIWHYTAVIQDVVDSVFDLGPGPLSVMLSSSLHCFEVPLSPVKRQKRKITL